MTTLPIERRAKFPEGKKMTVEEVAKVVGPEFAEMNEDPPESVKKVREDMEESMADHAWDQGHDIRSRLAHDLLPVERVASFPGKKRPGRGPAQGPDGFYMDVYEGPHVGWEPVNSMVDSRHPEMGYAPMSKQEVMRYTRGNKPWRVDEAKGGRTVAIWESEMDEGDADHDAWLARTPRAASEQQAEKLEAEAEANEAQADADREKADAARMKEGAGGLYGYTKGTQRDVEASVRKAQRRAASIAKTLYAKDERSVDFLKAHAKRANSKTARLILSAMKSIGPRVASAKTAGSGAANARYLASLDDRTELKILAAVAKHYGVTTSEIKDELIDRDAEALYEYLAFDRGMAMKVYRDFQSGRFASTKTSGLGIEAVKPDLFYVSTEDGDTYGPYRSKAEAGDASDDYYAATERESSPESGDRVLKSIVNPRRFVLNTPAELKRMSRMASAMLPVEKAAAKKTKAPVQEKVAGGLYGYPTKTARLALVACSDLRAYVGEVAYGLHSRRTAKYDRITGFLKEHGKTAKCAYSRMILSCYPDAPVAKAASAKSTDFKKGDRVMYWVHGKGTVTDLWNKGGKTGLTVEWDSGDVSHPMDRSRVMSDLQKVAAMPSQSVGAFVAKVDAARADAGLSMSDDEEAKDKYPWDDCIADQMKQYGDKATAEKVCGKIKAQSQGKSASVQSDVEKAIKNNEAILKQIKNDPEIDSKWVKALESQIASHRKMLDQIKSRGKSAAAKITDREYDALRPGQRIFMGVSGGFMQSGEKEFEVGRTSYSKKYDVYSKTLYPVEDGVPVKKGRAKWTLFKRPTGVTLGHGGMGTVIKSFRTASVSDQMLRKAFVPDSVNGWLEWEDGTRTAASKAAGAALPVEHKDRRASVYTDTYNKFFDALAESGQVDAALDALRSEIMSLALDSDLEWEGDGQQTTEGWFSYLGEDAEVIIEHPEYLYAQGPVTVDIKSLYRSDFGRIIERAGLAEMFKSAPEEIILGLASDVDTMEEENVDLGFAEEAADFIIDERVYGPDGADDENPASVWVSDEGEIRVDDVEVAGPGRIRLKVWKSLPFGAEVPSGRRRRRRRAGITLPVEHKNRKTAMTPYEKNQKAMLAEAGNSLKGMYDPAKLAQAIVKMRSFKKMVGNSVDMVKDALIALEEGGAIRRLDDDMFSQMRDEAERLMFPQRRASTRRRG